MEARPRCRERHGASLRQSPPVNLYLVRAARSLRAPARAPAVRAHARDLTRGGGRMLLAAEVTFA
jgi:hypothetical protein